MLTTKNKSNELTLTRLYNSPVKQVWDAWTDPKQAAKWWGPRGFTITTHKKDLRPGGTWNYTMHGPDGTDYPNATLYHEVEKYSRLVYDHGASEGKPPMFSVRVTFTELNGKTKMEMTMILPSAEAALETKKFIKQANGDSTWDRLAEYLDKETTGKEKFFINRSFAASADKLYEAWTEPEHLAQWLPPTGFNMKVITSNIKPGGQTFYSMSNDAGVTMYGRVEYLKFEKPDRLVYSQQFSDEKGTVARHPFAPTWPETMLTTVTFAKEDENQTRVTVEWQPYGHVSSEELVTFVAGRTGMTQGWGGSFDKLENYLVNA